MLAVDQCVEARFDPLMRVLTMGCVLAALGCSSGTTTTADAGPDAPASDAGDAGGPPVTNIKHIVVVVQENHTFDSYFARYCTAAAGSNPACTAGPACCERGPDKDPSGASPGLLDDNANKSFNPDHSQACEAREIDNGKMDAFVTDPMCGDPSNFVYADPTFLATYTQMAAGGALADRYFQPIVGQSSANDIYLARAAFEFTDNDKLPNAIGSACFATGFPKGEYADKTIGDVLAEHGVSWSFYAEGYQTMVDAMGKCPAPDPTCPVQLSSYPCVYDPGDNPFAFFPSVRDAATTRDFKAFAADVATGTLPAVSFVKPIGFRSEHPGGGMKITDGMNFVKGVTDAIQGSSVAASTLVLVTWDEGGGYFDHVSPPPSNAIDGKPYGTRVPLIAVGRFARKNFVSHVVMEHSSIVKFIEENFVGGSGQLGTRDTNVNDISSLLDPAETGLK